ncbi:hypothetical protein L2E82_23265 [Cichorium intybus]|uniref:Uncharacterized protein n=1 Tax=Cichorium intybus TaxID=13427 RepID=A0ACB9DZF9_CICIN|nr:hypothetical protein L2E82_23265 [Cichorium intybus]
MTQIDCRIIFYKPQLHVFTSSVSSTHGFDSNASRIIEERMALAIIGMYLLATSIIVVITGPGPDLLFNSTMGLVHNSLLVESVNGAEEQVVSLACNLVKIATQYTPLSTLHHVYGVIFEQKEIKGSKSYRFEMFFW